MITATTDKGGGDDSGHVFVSPNERKQHESGSGAGCAGQRQKDLEAREAQSQCRSVGRWSGKIHRHRDAKFATWDTMRYAAALLGVGLVIRKLYCHG